MRVAVGLHILSYLNGPLDTHQRDDLQGDSLQYSFRSPFSACIKVCIFSWIRPSFSILQLSQISSGFHLLSIFPVRRPMKILSPGTLLPEWPILHYQMNTTSILSSAHISNLKDQHTSRPGRWRTNGSGNQTQATLKEEKKTRSNLCICA